MDKVEEARILLSGQTCDECVYYIKNNFISPYCELSGKIIENTCEEWSIFYDVIKKRRYLLDK